MSHATPPLTLNLRKDDATFLSSVAEHVLGTSAVAATNAAGLTDHGFDATRIDTLIPWANHPVAWREHVFKKVEADPESPKNFGLFVRRKTAVPTVH